MTLAAELLGAFVGGIVAVVVSVALLGPRFVRWYMKRKLGGMMNVTSASMKQRSPVDLPADFDPSTLYSTRPFFTTPPKP